MSSPPAALQHLLDLVGDPGAMTRATPTAYAAIACHLAGRPEAKQLYQRSSELALEGSESLLQRSALYLNAESFRPQGQRLPAAAMVLRQLKASLDERSFTIRPKVYVNALALEAVSQLDRPNEDLKAFLVDGGGRPLPDGSYFGKPWITAHALTALFFARCKGRDIGPTRAWLEKQCRNGEFEGDGDDVPAVTATAYSVLALMRTGAGLDAPAVKEGLAHLRRVLPKETRPTPVAVGTIALLLEALGKVPGRLKYEDAQVVIENSTYQHVEYIQEKVMGSKINIQDSVIHKSSFGGENVEDDAVVNTGRKPGRGQPTAHGRDVCPSRGKILSDLPEWAENCPACGAPLE